MLIRPARMADAEAIADTLRRSIRDLCAADYGSDARLLARWLANKRADVVEGWIADPDALVLVAETSGDVAGVASMTAGGEVTLNYVAPEARFRGVSAALLAALEDEARRRGLEACRLQSTLTAYRFYLARGYRPVEPDAPPQRGTAMVKALA